MTVEESVVIDSLMEYVTLRILHLEADLAVAEVMRDAALYEQTRGAVRELQQMVNEWVKPRMGAAL